LELWTTQFPNYGDDWLAFLTRWVSHLAAPGFFFLLGVGAILFSGNRRAVGWSEARITAHLAIRGAILIVLQFTLENMAWAFGNAGPSRTYFGVLYALGAALIVISVVRLMNRWVLVGLSAAALVAIEFVLPAPTTEWVVNEPWQLLFLWPGLGETTFVLYPLIPWLGVALMGAAFGKWVRDAPQRAQAWMIPLGLVSLGAFVVLRARGGFGNIVEPAGDELMSFLNVVKYPPSLTFILLTLGLGLIFAGVVWRTDWSPRPLLIFGSTPLFFYITHLWIYAAMGQIVEPDGLGLTFPFYLLWLLGLGVLLPACAWYGRFKSSRPAASLWRML
jgi:uncharacterized membrane protein